MAYQSLDEIVANTRQRQAYLTGSYDNTIAVAGALKRMGLGERFEYVGSGDAALVIAPEGHKDIVIRLGTEFEEPDKWCYNPMTGTEEKMFRAQIPQVLQALHTEKLRVIHNPEFSTTRTTQMRIEILPRVQTIRDNDDQGKWEKYGTRLMQELWVSGYKIHDPKVRNIGLLTNRTKSPLFIDPGEIEQLTRKEKIFSKADILSHAATSFKRRTTGYQWAFEDQTAGLTRNWKKYIVDHQKIYDTEMQELFDRMIQPSEKHAEKYRERTPDGNPIAR